MAWHRLTDEQWELIELCYLHCCGSAPLTPTCLYVLSQVRMSPVSLDVRITLSSTQTSRHPSPGFVSSPFAPSRESENSVRKRAWKSDGRRPVASCAGSLLPLESPLDRNHVNHVTLRCKWNAGAPLAIGWIPSKNVTYSSVLFFNKAAGSFLRQNT